MRQRERGFCQCQCRVAGEGPQTPFERDRKGDAIDSLDKLARLFWELDLSDFWSCGLNI